MEHLPVRRIHQEAHPVPAQSITTSIGRYVDVDPAAGENELGQWLQYWDMLKRRKLTLLVTSLCAVCIAFVVSLYQTPLYMATATLEIQNTASAEPFEGISFMNNYDPYLRQTQIQLLTSGALQERVYAKLSGAPGSLSAPNPLGTVRDRLHLPFAGHTSNWEEGIAVASGSVQVAPVKDSRIVHLVSQSTLPQAAAAYVNTLAEQFIEQNHEDKWAVYQSTGAWLTRAQQELKAKLEESEQRLLSYASESGLVVTSRGEDDVQNIGEQRLVQIQAELTRSQAERIVKESIYREMMSRQADGAGSVVDSGPMAAYQIKLADLRRELADARTALTDSNPKVHRLQAQIAEIESAQAGEKTFILNRLQADYQAALRREQKLSADFANESKIVSGQDQRLIRYKTLKREVETYRKLFETTLKQGNEAAVASALRPVSARVVDEARAPLSPYKPDLGRNLGYGLFGGLLVGVGFIFLRERADSSIRTPGSNALHFNVRELGVIPSVAAVGELPAGNRRRFSLPSAAAASTPREQALDGVELATWNQRASLVAESFRATLTSILMSGQNGHGARAILVTSPSPQEGKSTVVTNLGVALAEIKQRVLLIDADLRRPRIHTIFNQANTWGLIDLLSDSTPCAQYSVDALGRKTHIPGLFTLPSGPITADSARLLYSPRMAELLGRLCNEFDAVLIDTPPVLSVADARILSRLVDAVLLVIRAGQTQRDAANMALNVFDSDGVPVLGTVLNDWNPRDTAYGDYYGSYYAYDSASSSSDVLPYGTPDGPPTR